MQRRSFLVGGISLVGTSSIMKTNEASASTKNNYLDVVMERYAKKQREVMACASRHKHSFPSFLRHEPFKVCLSKYDHDVLIKTIWGETRGETKQGRIAVVHVILNRKYKDNVLFKKCKTISQLCLKKYQFSCWLDRWKMNHIKVDDTYKDVKETVEEAINLYEKGFDYSNGALFYYSDIMKKPPAWAKKYEKVNKIGLHNFFAV